MRKLHDFIQRFLTANCLIDIVLAEKQLELPDDPDEA